MSNHEAAVGAAELGRLLDMSSGTIKRHANLGKIPGFRTGGATGHWRFYPSVVQAHLAASAEPGWNQSPQSRGRRRKAA